MTKPMARNVPSEGRKRPLAEAHEEIRETLEEIKAYQRELRHPYVRPIMVGPPGTAALDD